MGIKNVPFSFCSFRSKTVFKVKEQKNSKETYVVVQDSHLKLQFEAKFYFC